MLPGPLDPKDLAGRCTGWLDAPGPEGDVVISCRVRLARNLKGFPFHPKLSADRARELADRLRGVLLDARLDGETWWVPMEEAGPVLRSVLQERHLVSRDLLAPHEGRDVPGRAVALGESETLSVMVGEEDHLRLQALAPGLDLDLAWQRAQVLDRYLEGQLEFAHDAELGYLTACPSNVGTGLRASVMLHLPALGSSRRELERVFAAAQHTGLAVRGQQGEGSRAVGDIYQLSNQVTLGKSEEQLIAGLERLVRAVIGFERRMREALLADRPGGLRDRVSRSVGELRTARSLTTEEAQAHLSNLRLGVQLGLLERPATPELNRLALQVQKGHVHALSCDGEGVLAPASERDKLRAAHLRNGLGS